MEFPERCLWRAILLLKLIKHLRQISEQRTLANAITGDTKSLPDNIAKEKAYYLILKSMITKQSKKNGYPYFRFYELSTKTFKKGVRSLPNMSHPSCAIAEGRCM